MRYRCARVVGRRTQCRFEQYRHLSALWAARPAGRAGHPRGALPDFGSFSRGELNARRGLVHASPGLQDSWCGIFGAPVFTTFSRLRQRAPAAIGPPGQLGCRQGEPPAYAIMAHCRAAYAGSVMRHTSKQSRLSINQARSVTSCSAAHRSRLTTCPMHLICCALIAAASALATPSARVHPHPHLSRLSTRTAP